MHRYARVLLMFPAILGGCETARIARPQTVAQSEIPPTAAPKSRSRNAATANEIVEHIRAHYYDAARAERWANENRDYGADIGDCSEFARETNARLAQLGASHTRYFGPRDAKTAQLKAIFEEQFPGIKHVSIGAQFEELEADTWFAVSVFPDGPAARGGLLRGDRVIRAAGRPFHPFESLQGAAGKPVSLAVQRQKDGPLLEVVVTPRRIAPGAEWEAAQRNASRVIEHHGRRIAYAWLWVCAGEAPQRLLEDMISDQFADAEALIIDFRDGWGGCNPRFLNVLDPAVPTISSTDRHGETVRYEPVWKKPLVVVINRRSSSGKELVAHAVKRSKRGMIVGEHTAGALLAARPISLGDNGVLYVAVADVQVDGVRLEGRGIAPDVEAPDDVRYAAGSDTALVRALDVASRLVKSSRYAKWLRAGQAITTILP